MKAEAVAAVYQGLTERGIRVCIQGGWGVDALLGRQTRSHKDLDLFVLVDDLVPLRQFLADTGFVMEYVWPENLWIEDASGERAATAFVVSDDADRQLDFHVARIRADGAWEPVWSSGRIFAPEDLSGIGDVAGVEVRCYSPQMQMAVRTGYALPSEHVDDMRSLHDVFGVTYPAEHARLGQTE